MIAIADRCIQIGKQGSILFNRNGGGKTPAPAPA
jgi:hypothetical protein